MTYNFNGSLAKPPLNLEQGRHLINAWIYMMKTFMQYMGLCIFISFVMFVKPEVWIISHCLQVRSLNNGMHCMSHYVLMEASDTKGI